MSGVLDSFSLNGKIAVVTAASRGIGRGIASCLAEAGADVVVAARNKALLQEVAAEIESRGRRAHVFAGDLTDEQASARLATETQDRFGKLDIWVNIGGQPGNRPLPFLETDSGYFDEIVALNLKSFWAGTLHAARNMPDGGSIVSISSRASLLGPRVNNALYGAMKASINHLTATLATEFAPSIRINAVAPGPVATDTLMGMMKMDDATLRVSVAGTNPLGRIGEPRDIGAAVVFLASPAASWISGQCLFVTGGAL